MEGKLWVRLIRHNKIVRDITLPCSANDWEETLREACRQMDLSAPIPLPRHLRDWDRFKLMRFLPSDFMDAVSFDRMETEYFEEGAPRKRDRDPRNA